MSLHEPDRALLGGDLGDDEVALRSLAAVRRGDLRSPSNEARAAGDKLMAHAHCSMAMRTVLTSNSKFFVLRVLIPFKGVTMVSNSALAWIVTFVAASSTVCGSLFTIFVNNDKLPNWMIAASMSMAAGVMLYVSVES